MGRHSAPDGEEEERQPAEPARTAVASGRHASGAEADVDAGRRPAPKPAAEAAPEPQAAEPSAPSRADDQHAGTRGDLQLLREDSRLRMRCAAAAVAPFVIFTALLVALGRADVYLIWLWIPTVLAGVLVGALLDAAHRRRRERPPGDAAA